MNKSPLSDRAKILAAKVEAFPNMPTLADVPKVVAAMKEIAELACDTAQQIDAITPYLDE